MVNRKHTLVSRIEYRQALNASDLTGTRRLVALVVADRDSGRGCWLLVGGRDDPLDWPHRVDLTTETGLSPSTVSRALKDLVAKGWLRKQRYGHSFNYFITIPRAATRVSSKGVWGVTMRVTVSPEASHSDTQNRKEPVQGVRTRVNALPPPWGAPFEDLFSWAEENYPAELDRMRRKIKEGSPWWVADDMLKEFAEGKRGQRL